MSIITGMVSSRRIGLTGGFKIIWREFHYGLHESSPEPVSDTGFDAQWGSAMSEKDPKPCADPSRDGGVSRRKILSTTTGMAGVLALGGGIVAGTSSSESDSTLRSAEEDGPPSAEPTERRPTREYDVGPGKIAGEHDPRPMKEPGRSGATSARGNETRWPEDPDRSEDANGKR